MRSYTPTYYNVFDSANSGKPNTTERVDIRLSIDTVLDEGLGSADMEKIKAVLDALKYARWYTHKVQPKLLRHIENVLGLKNGDVFIVSSASRAGGETKRVLTFDSLITGDIMPGYDYLFNALTKSFNRTTRKVRVPNIIHMERIARLGPVSASLREIPERPDDKHQEAWKLRAACILEDK